MKITAVSMKDLELQYIWRGLLAKEEPGVLCISAWAETHIRFASCSVMADVQGLAMNGAKRICVRPDTQVYLPLK